MSTVSTSGRLAGAGFFMLLPSYSWAQGEEIATNHLIYQSKQERVDGHFVTAGDGSGYHDPLGIAIVIDTCTE